MQKQLELLKQQYKLTTHDLQNASQLWNNKSKQQEKQKEEKEALEKTKEVSILLFAVVGSKPNTERPARA